MTMLDEATAARAVGPPLDGRVMPKTNGRNWARCFAALSARRDGKTLAEIGRFMGVSRERARQMIIAAERRELAVRNMPACPLDVLSERARNCLLSESGGRPGPSPQEVREWMNTYRLHKIPNMGKKSIQEVAAWLAAIGA